MFRLPQFRLVSCHLSNLTTLIKGWIWWQRWIKFVMHPYILFTSRFRLQLFPWDDIGWHIDLGTVCSICRCVMKSFSTTGFLSSTIAFSALRVFAIWDCHIPMTLLVFALNLVPFVTNMACVLLSFDVIRSRVKAVWLHWINGYLYRGSYICLIMQDYP